MWQCGSVLSLYVLFLFEDAVTMLRWCVFVEKPILESLRYWTLSAPDRYPRGFTGHVAHPSRSIADRKRNTSEKCPPQPRLYLWGMTTQEKVAAIKEIVAYHDDNVAAVKAANLKPGLDAVVTDAMKNALKDDLSLVFALKPPKALG